MTLKRLGDTKNKQKTSKNENFTAKTENLNLKAENNKVKMQSDETLTTRNCFLLIVDGKFSC